MSEITAEDEAVKRFKSAWEHADRTFGEGATGQRTRYALRSLASEGFIAIIDRSASASASLEDGRRLASEREGLIAQGVDPSSLIVPLAPVDEDGLTSGEQAMAAALWKRWRDPNAPVITLCQDPRTVAQVAFSGLRQIAPVATPLGEPHEHGDWDQGGYCNRLVMRDGAADTCGYQKPRVSGQRSVEAINWVDPPDRDFKLGARVVKRTGYRFPGTVRSIFTTAASKIRLVVEFEDDSGMLHIFAPHQLEVFDPICHCGVEESAHHSVDPPHAFVEQR